MLHPCILLVWQTGQGTQVVFTPLHCVYADVSNRQMLAHVRHIGTKTYDVINNRKRGRKRQTRSVKCSDSLMQECDCGARMH